MAWSAWEAARTLIAGGRDGPDPARFERPVSCDEILAFAHEPAKFVIALAETRRHLRQRNRRIGLERPLRRRVGVDRERCASAGRSFGDVRRDADMTQEDVPPNRIDPDLAMAALRPLQGFTLAAHLLDGDGRRAAGGLIGLRPLLRLEVELGEANEARCGERSLGAIGLLPCRVRSQHQLLGLAVAAEALVDLGELAEGAKGMHRVCAVLLLLQIEGTFVERLGLGIAPLRAVELRQLLDSAGGMLALGPLLLLPDRQRAFQQRLGFAIAALGDIELSQLVHAESREAILRVACVRTSFLRLLVVQVRFGAAPLLAVDLRRCFRSARAVCSCSSASSLVFSRIASARFRSSSASARRPCLT